jgi:hypothetical protein
MNTVDGSWRLIYVGPNGQLIGSLGENHNTFFFGTPAPTSFGGALATGTNGTSGVPSTNPTSPFPSLSPSSSTSPLDSIGALGSQISSNISSANLQDANASNAQNSQNPGPDSSTPAATPQSNDQIFGRTIVIGVGSKINKTSFLKYKGASNYLKFEFIWNGSDAVSGTVSR